MNTPETKAPEAPTHRFEEAYKRADRLMTMLPENREMRFDPIWRDFFALTAIPRASGKEQLAGDFLEYVGTERGFQTERDAVGNILWRIPASSTEYADPKKSVLLQVHQDMVSKGNPSPALHGVEPEVVEKDGNWFVQSKDNKTTLGADDGIMVGVAMQIPQLLQNQPHGELAVLFTVDEEQGLNGAKALEFDLGTYGNYLNLDSEEDHEITIGSAAVGDSFITLPITRIPVTPEQKAFTLKAEQFKGGHSGVKIGDETRKNAIKELVNLVAQARNEGEHISISSAAADGPMNAIPDAAELTVVCRPEGEELLRNLLTTKQNALASVEAPSAQLSLSPTSAVTTLNDVSSANLLALISELPHGVLEREPYDASLVRTSTNLARLTLNPDESTASIGMMSRSSDNDAIKKLRESLIVSIATARGADVSHAEASPAWEPVKDGDLALRISNLHEELFGTPMRQVTTHGGLETSYIIVKYPQFKGHIASIGANVNNAHETMENTEGPSVERTTRLVMEVVTSIAKEKSTRRSGERD